MSEAAVGLKLPRGVSFYARTGKFVARYTAEGVTRNLGYFDTPEDAAEAYFQAGGGTPREAKPRAAPRPKAPRSRSDKGGASQKTGFGGLTLPSQPKTGNQFPRQMSDAFWERSRGENQPPEHPARVIGQLFTDVWPGLRDAGCRGSDQLGVSVLAVFVIDGLLDHPATVEGLTEAVRQLNAGGALALVTDAHAHTLSQYVPRLRAEEFAAILAATSDLV